MMGECKRQASDEEERGQANDGGVQEAGEWWGRDMQQRHATDGGRDMQQRHATDGGGE